MNLYSLMNSDGPFKLNTCMHTCPALEQYVHTLVWVDSGYIHRHASVYTVNGHYHNLNDDLLL